MIIEEGETVNYVQNINALEVAIIDRSDTKEDRVVAVPLQRLKPRVVREDSQLPFTIELLKSIPNARLEVNKGSGKNLATTGAGKSYVAKEIPAGKGTDVGGQVDLSAAYVKLKAPNGKSLGTRLLALELTFGKVEEQVEVDGKTYDVSLRFERNDKPYSVHLVDLHKDDYIGTSTVKNYSSDIRLVDGSRHVDRNLSIWMNNPLRFAGGLLLSKQLPSRSEHRRRNDHSASRAEQWLDDSLCLVHDRGRGSHRPIRARHWRDF